MLVYNFYLDEILILFLLHSGDGTRTFEIPSQKCTILCPCVALIIGFFFCFSSVTYGMIFGATRHISFESALGARY